MSLEECKRKRSNIKRNISRIKSIVEAVRESEDKLSNAELQCRLGILESYFKQALSVQVDIEDLDPTDNGRADLEDSYVAVKLSIQVQLGEDVNTTVHYPETPAAASVTPSSHLPRLSLPTFSGDYADYKNFITTFTQIIAREPRLSNIEKFNYLLSCLKGAALETVKAFQVTNENYSKALDRLKERFDNPTLIFLEGIASLFTAPEKSNAQQLRSLVDKASAIYSSLESLGLSTSIAQAMLIYIVMGKCDQQTKNKWNESLDYNSLPTWPQCTKVLERHCQFLHSSESSSQRKPEAGKQTRLNIRNQSSSFAITNPTCVLCSSSNHKVVGCSQFKDMNTNQRFDLIKRYDLCINCLGNGHKMAQCPSKNRCRTCNRAHHTLLHHENASQTVQITQSTVSASQPSGSNRSTWQTSSQQSAATHSHMGASEEGQVILATALVLVKDVTGAYKLGRALLDSCSQLNFITDDFAQKLRLRREKHNVGVRSIGESLTNLKSRTTTTIKSRTSAFQLSLQFGITSHIAYQPETEIDTSDWNLPANTKLADEKFFKPRCIDLLLGTEAFFDALAVGQIRLGSNLPILQKTSFGWVVSGRLRNERNVTASSCLLSNESSIDENLQRLWKLEAISTPTKSIQPEHRICEEIFMKTVRQDNTGCIIVSMPFKDDPICLGDSFDVARRRFLALERRLLSSPEIRPQYIAFMEEYEGLGHMSEVAQPNLKEPHYYIPHHCVLKPSSTSTKLRVVFDASCRTSSQTSLNDLLLVGPTIQQDLYMLLLRFRLYRYAITADVAKMYRQVLVDNNFRQFQYVLWRASPDSDIRTYQLNTVTYGTASAPFLAVRSLHYLADEHMAELPIGASAIKSSFYVDDMLCGAEDVNELYTLKHQVVEVLRRGQFPLSKWHSNHPDFMEGQATKELSITDDYPNARNIQLHGFCDASIRAYGCSVYVRTEDLRGHVVVQLLTSKSGVAPVKKQSLPKLELCGAHLLACLYAEVKEIFANKPINSYFWTNSQLVLYWLKQHSITLSTFVGNRVSDIQELTGGGQWRHVPTRDNPADLVSRGCSTADLKSSSWFSGPAFLLQDQSKWPNNKALADLDANIINAEKRKTAFTVIKEINHILDVMNGISSYPHCLRFVAWLFRFSDSCRKQSTFTTASPSPEELRRASHCIVWNTIRPALSSSRAPHFGGLWEAAVKSAKRLLYRTLAHTRLTFEELSTVAVEIEAILNSRPLSQLSSDPNDFEVLTAGHFLVGSLEDRNISNLDRYDMITAIKQRFWPRWSADYVNELRARVKWTTPAPNLTEDTLVIIHDDNLPPQRWKLGQVESTALGRDGHSG
ncbi:uncharacterized protein LOC118734620 [Rhagoletis pomonella]|uniref:uncharacterized protein LOC118734620 n=1 Tax=Rhagoletis pomonella TaxID=28610 RepID=UPI00177A7684|nr:uncharacterized protein LOC118734620 [Rhagoletis pomonella]